MGKARPCTVSKCVAVWRSAKNVVSRLSRVRVSEETRTIYLGNSGWANVKCETVCG